MERLQPPDAHLRV